MGFRCGKTTKKDDLAPTFPLTTDFERNYWCHITYTGWTHLCGSFPPIPAAKLTGTGGLRSGDWARRCIICGPYSSENKYDYS